jgi:hypothetical protein
MSSVSAKGRTMRIEATEQHMPKLTQSIRSTSYVAARVRAVRHASPRRRRIDQRKPAALLLTLMGLLLSSTGWGIPGSSAAPVWNRYLTNTHVHSVDNVAKELYPARHPANVLSSQATTNVSPTTDAELSSSEQIQTPTAGPPVTPATLATSTTPGAVVFNDDFETGDLSRWTSPTGLTVEQAIGFSGSPTLVARANTATADPSYARQTISDTQADLFASMRVKIVSQDRASTVSLLKFRTASDDSILTLAVDGSGRLGVHNDVMGAGHTSSQTVTPGEWHEIQAHIRVDAANTAAGMLEIWYDGKLLPDLSMAQDFGTSPVGRFQLGEHAPGQIYDFVFDDIVLDTSYIETSPTASPTPTATPELISSKTPTAELPATPTPAASTTPGTVVFSDGFESGDLSRWTSVIGTLGVQQQEVGSGTWAARATSNSAPAYASKDLDASETDLYYRIKFKLLAPPQSSLYLGKVRTNTNDSILGLYIAASGKLSYRNDAGQVTRTSSQRVSPGQWHEVQVHVQVNHAEPGAGQVQVWYDGTPVAELSRTEDLGTAPIGRLQLGENSAERTFDIAFDDVVADTTFIESEFAPRMSSAPASAQPDLVANADASATAQSRASQPSTPPATETVRSGESLAPVCKESSPPDESYTVNLCITVSADGTRVDGNQTIEGSIDVAGNDPGVQSLTFFLDGEHLISDFESGYSFILPTERWEDGIHTLAAAATMRDDFESERTTTDVTFSNGVTTPPVNDNTFTPASGTVPPAGQPFVLAATGDGAGGETGATLVVDMIDSWHPNMFLYLGDVYDIGSSTEFFNWYAPEDSFGRFRAITNPTVGNHEYLTEDAKGYFDYWDNVPPYYSFDAAGWHLISLNSNGPKDAQQQWLRQDLQANQNACTIAYFHHPLFSIGPLGDSDQDAMKDLWTLLDQQGVDIVLTGHEHNYQRWKPLDGAGELDPNGITEFVVGTGGHGIQRLAETDSRVSASDATKGDYGALRLELNSGEASFQYITTAGQKDSGRITCDEATKTMTPTPDPPTTALPSRTADSPLFSDWFESGTMPSGPT